MNRAAGWEGGAGGRRRGPVAGGPAQRVPAMGRHEDITALVFERAEQGQVPRRAGTSIVTLGRSFMPSRRTERIQISGVAVSSVRLDTTREACERSERHLCACLSPAASSCGTERSESGRRAGECLRFRRGRAWPWSGVECSGLKRRSQASLRRQSANQSAKAQTRRCEA